MSQLIGYLLLAVIISFVCSVFEAVLLSITPSFVAAAKNEKRRYAPLLEKYKQDIDRPLAAILTLNTFANTIGAAGVGASALAIWGASSVALASGALTLVILFFSEIIPKSLGATFWRQLTPVVMTVLPGFVFMTFPFVKLSRVLSRLINSDNLERISLDEISAMNELGLEAGVLEAREVETLSNYLKLNSTPISEIMTPRTVLFTQKETMTVQEFYSAFPDAQFSRIPLYSSESEEINSYVLKIDVYKAYIDGQLHANLKSLSRTMISVPEVMIIKDVLHIFLDQQVQASLVVDEHGSITGLVTMEDVIEALFGLEIVDEADKIVDMQAFAKRLWTIRSKRLNLEDEENQQGSDLKE